MGGLVTERDHRGSGNSTDVLIGVFKDFGGDERFLDRLQAYAANRAILDNIARESSPREILEKMKKIKKDARKLRDSLGRLIGRDDKGLWGRLKRLEEDYGSAIKMREKGVSLLGSGSLVKNFSAYFFLAALVPYTEFVSGEPQWKWIRNYLITQIPDRSETKRKERFARIKTSWRKMLDAYKRCEAVIKDCERLKPSSPEADGGDAVAFGDSSGRVAYMEELAPNHCKVVLGAVRDGGYSFLEFMSLQKNKGKKKSPLAWKLSSAEKNYLLAAKKWLPFLASSLSRWGKPPVKPLTPRRWKR